MKTLLRHLARRWANKALVWESDRLRRNLIRAEATVERQTEAMRKGEETLTAATTELTEATTRLADLSRANLLASARVAELEQATDADEFGAKWQQANRCLLIVTAERDEATATIKDLRDRLEQKEDQIERQADLFEQLRDQTDKARARVAELEQTVVAMAAKAGLNDAAWDDVANVAGPETRQP